MQQRAGTGRASVYGTHAVALYLTGFAVFVGLYLPQPILPLLGRDFDVDPQQAALVVSAAILGIALASPIIGVLSDRYGRRRLLLIGSAVLALLSLLCAWAPSFELLITFRFLLGLMLPALLVVGVAYVSEALSPAAMRAVAGIYVGATVIGGMSGRLLAGIFADQLDWRYGFGLSAILYLALLALWGLVPKPSRPQKAARTLREALGGTLGHLRNRAILGGILVGFFLFFAFQSTFSYLPFRLEAPPFSFSSTLIAVTYLTYAAGVVSSGIAGWLQARTSLRFGLIAGFTATIVGNLLTLAPGVPLLLGGLIVLCFGNWLVHGLALGYVATAAANDRAGANALYLLLYYLGGSLGAYLPGFLFPHLGYSGVVGSSVLALLAGLAGAALLTGRSDTTYRSRTDEVRP